LESALFKACGYLKGLLYWPRLSDFKPIRVHGFPKIKKHNGKVSVGRRTTLWPGVKFSVISKDPARPAVLRIGAFSSIGDRTQVHCCRQVDIGDYVLISWGVNILENYYHGTEDDSVQSAPVMIEDRVWIGCNVIILAGVTIGQGSIIAAGSVVTKSVPPGMLVAGNPAREIRPTKPWCE
jgi:acetyltransferase-like isoleucine patch superfamily enzyme